MLKYFCFMGLFLSSMGAHASDCTKAQKEAIDAVRSICECRAVLTKSVQGEVVKPIPELNNSCGNTGYVSMIEIVLMSLRNRDYDACLKLTKVMELSISWPMP